MRKQTCNNCIAFDDYINDCRLHNLITGRKVKICTKDQKLIGEITKFYPITKCNKPKNKQEFYTLLNLNYQKFEKSKNY